MTTYNWIMVGVVAFNAVCAFVAFFLYNPIIARLKSLESEAKDLNSTINDNKYHVAERFVSKVELKDFIDRNDKTLNDLNAYLKTLLKS
ncbi:hypothetical protein ACOI22_03420 [Glaciecola sp. 2405UD65-10]|uniref:hypothetical protein n=1 Tax=Glaciecola sp. 2405UD65-10 TaxID=3397244 RepID=UPI003B5B31BF